MARKSTPAPRKEPTLTPEQAKVQLEDALRRGRKLLEEGSISKERYDAWDRNTLRIVTSAFGEWSGHDTDFIGPQRFTVGPVSEAHAEYERRKNLERQIRVLEAQIEGLPTVVPQSQDISATVESVINRKVFVVHGHQHGARETVARYLEKLNLEPVILDEEPSRGRTIIEKFEDHSDVAFAVVLIIGDDIGGVKGSDPSKLRPRARQNVILELGFFLGKLGRHRVCALYEPDVEMPSDFGGVGFVKFDGEGNWRVLIAKELNASGLKVDMNAALLS